MTVGKPKTPKQNRTLNYLLTEAGLDGDLLRDYLESVCGKRLRRDMDFYDYQKCIKDLNEKLGGRIKDTMGAGAAAGRKVQPDAGHGESAEAAPPKIHGRLTDPITAAQMKYIQRLYEQLGADKARQIELNRRTCKKPWPQTIGQGQKIIQMLLDLIKRNYDVNKIEDAKQPECNDNKKSGE